MQAAAVYKPVPCFAGFSVSGDGFGSPDVIGRQPADYRQFAETPLQSFLLYAA